MKDALETKDLGKRYGNTWALRNCSLNLPVGRVAGLVGPNGAGKTTLLHLAMGLLQPTTGSVEVFGSSPRQQPTKVLARIGFVAQDRPLYKAFTVRDMLTFGSKLNPRWDKDLARKRLEQLSIPLSRAVGKLSGGQQAQVVLVMALAKRPELLLLDEPVANLDPLARREFLQTLMDAKTADGLTILLSSHLIADLNQICDYLIILSASRIQVASDVDHLIQTHKWLIGPRDEFASVAHNQTVLQIDHTSKQSSLLVRTGNPIPDSSWKERQASLEEIILAYLAQPAAQIAESEHNEQEASL